MKEHNTLMEGRKKFLAAGATAALVVGGGAAKWGDDIARSLRAAPDRPPVSGGVAEAGGGVIGGATHLGSAAQVESQLDAFVVTVGDGISATPEAAREAGLSSACAVLYIAFTESRLPTDDEWVEIGVDAVATAAIDVPIGSGVWRELEHVKDEVANAVSDSLGYVDDAEAESVADELSCAWA